MNAALVQRFRERTNAEAGDGCWLWMAGANEKGYGQITFAGVPHLAHRLSWEMANGPIPLSLCVLHSCDTPACVNPAHLFLGTHLDNARDRQAKGRGARNTNGNEAKTHCPAGHSYSPENTRKYSGRRHCRSCARAHTATYRSRQALS